MNYEYVTSVNAVLDNLTEAGFKRFNPVKSILTENSNEIQLINNTIIIHPIGKCIAITIRGLMQSRSHMERSYSDWVYGEFKEFIISTKSPEGLNYEDFIKKRINCMPDYYPHLLCLYLEDSSGELDKYGMIYTDMCKRYFNSLLASKKYSMYRTYYEKFKCHIFNGGIMLRDADENGDMNTIEIKASKDSIPVEIKKFKLYLECDRWYNRE